MQQWEHQPDLQERRICPPQYVSPRPFNNEMAIPQNYNSSQMPLIVSWVCIEAFVGKTHNEHLDIVLNFIKCQSI